MDKLVDYFKNFTPGKVMKPYIIAEAGVNHEGSMDLAKRLIDEAQEGGAQAIKFQTYKAETIASKDSPYYWDITKEPTRSQFELFKKYDKFWKGEYEALKKHCDTAGIEFMSTPFDTASADFLNELMPVFKISSSDITNLPFIDYMCKFNKPIILSTGASYLWEIQQAVEVIQRNGNPLNIMHCVLNYPTPNENANIGRIKGLIKTFPDILPGYSDHTLPQEMDVLLYAHLLGAIIIEKHFSHDKTLPGNDHYHAMDKEDLKVFWNKYAYMKELYGSDQVTSNPSEEPARRNARRSLVAQGSIPEGKTIDRSDLTWKRPAHGISPRSIEELLGKKALKNIEEDTVLQWNMFD